MIVESTGLAFEPPMGTARIEVTVGAVIELAADLEPGEHLAE